MTGPRWGTGQYWRDEAAMDASNAINAHASHARHQGDTMTDENEDLTRKHAIGLLKPWYEQKQAKEAAESWIAQAVGTNENPGLIRQYAIDHPEDALDDGELYYAEKGTSSTGQRLDVMTMSKSNEGVAALLTLAELGLLSLNMTAWKAHPKDFIEAETVKRFIIPGGQTMRLTIKRRDS